MQEKIQAYRQPMVTATGILLGFLLNVASAWGNRTLLGNPFKEIAIAIGVFGSIGLLLVVLYRILSMQFPKDKEEAYYKRTLFYFILGLVVVFLSLLIVMIESYIIYRK